MKNFLRNKENLFAIVLSAFMGIMMIRVIGKNSTDGNWTAYWYGLWGDWNVHLSFTNAFLERGWLWWLKDHPSAMGEAFRYPWLSHAIQAIITIPFRWFCHSQAEATIYSLWFTSVALLMGLPWLAKKIAEEFDLKTETKIGAILLVCFFGGFGFLTIDPSHATWTNDAKKHVEFTHFLTSEWIPQRSFLFALYQWALGAWLYKRSLRRGTRSTAALVTWGLLPLVHVHTWIASSLFIGLTWLRDKNLKNIAGLILISAIALGILFHGTSQFSNTWNLWNPGWKLAGNPLFFWLTNTGLLIPWAIVALWKTRGLGFSGIRWFGILGTVLFVIATFINFQAHTYDNLKLYTYAVIALAPLLVEYAWFHLPRAIAIILIGVHLIGGFHDSLAMIGHAQRATWFTKGEIQLADDWMKVRTPEQSEARALSPPRHHHWLPVLTAQPVVMSYAGWLWTWGIRYQSLEKYWEKVKNKDLSVVMDLQAANVKFIAFDPGQGFLNGEDSVAAKIRAKAILKSDAGELWEVSANADRQLNPSVEPGH